MSHVVSSQPSSTSPYQPTEIQDNSNNPPRISATYETQPSREECCFRADKSQGCFLYYCCNFLAGFCGGIRDCTDFCCNACANCLNDCCEDKPNDKNGRRYRNTHLVNYNNYNDDNTWVVGAFQHNDANRTLDDGDNYRLTHDSSVDYVSDDNPDRHNINCHNSGTHHSSGHHNSGTHHSTGHHDSGTHHSSGHHDSGTHHSSGHHDSATHHSSGHPDSGTHHSSGHHDSGGHPSSGNDSSAHHDSGGGCDTAAGGDSGGGCDSGGGGDSGGGCDSGGGGDPGGCGCDD